MNEKNPVPSETKVVVCPRCREKLRMPRRNTELRVTCPHCAVPFLHSKDRSVVELIDGLTEKNDYVDFECIHCKGALRGPRLAVNADFTCAMCGKETTYSPPLEPPPLAKPEMLASATPAPSEKASKPSTSQSAIGMDIGDHSWFKCVVAFALGSTAFATSVLYSIHYEGWSYIWIAGYLALMVAAASIDMNPLVAHIAALLLWGASLSKPNPTTDEAANISSSTSMPTKSTIKKVVAVQKKASTIASSAALKRYYYSMLYYKGDNIDVVVHQAHSAGRTDQKAAVVKKIAFYRLHETIPDCEWYFTRVAIFSLDFFNETRLKHFERDIVGSNNQPLWGNSVEQAIGRAYDMQGGSQMRGQPVFHTLKDMEAEASHRGCLRLIDRSQE